MTNSNLLLYSRKNEALNLYQVELLNLLPVFRKFVLYCVISEAAPKQQHKNIGVKRCQLIFMGTVFYMGKMQDIKMYI